MLGDYAGIIVVICSVDGWGHVQLHLKAVVADHEGRPWRHLSSGEGQHRQRWHCPSGTVGIDHRQAKPRSRQARHQKTQGTALWRHHISQSATFAGQAPGKTLQGLDRSKGVAATGDGFGRPHVGQYASVALLYLFHADHADPGGGIKITDLEMLQQVQGRGARAAPTTAEKTAAIDQRTHILMFQLESHGLAPGVVCG
ncbi:hypothetical protein D9M71_334360 [compost metagenome]